MSITARLMRKLMATISTSINSGSLSTTKGTRENEQDLTTKPVALSTYDAGAVDSSRSAPIHNYLVVRWINPAQHVDQPSRKNRWDATDLSGTPTAVCGCRARQLTFVSKPRARQIPCSPRLHGLFPHTHAQGTSGSLSVFRSRMG